MCRAPSMTSLMPSPGARHQSQRAQGCQHPAPALEVQQVQPASSAQSPSVYSLTWPWSINQRCAGRPSGMQQEPSLGGGANGVPRQRKCRRRGGVQAPSQPLAPYMRPEQKPVLCLTPTVLTQPAHMQLKAHRCVVLVLSMAGLPADTAHMHQNMCMPPDTKYMWPPGCTGAGAQLVPRTLPSRHTARGHHAKARHSKHKEEERGMGRHAVPLRSNTPSP
jgi:hypothetical protein